LLKLIVQLTPSDFQSDLENFNDENESELEVNDDADIYEQEDELDDLKAHKKKKGIKKGKNGSKGKKKA
jgi:hypothetical protein